IASHAYDPFTAAHRNRIAAGGEGGESEVSIGIGGCGPALLRVLQADDGAGHSATCRVSQRALPRCRLLLTGRRQTAAGKNYHNDLQSPQHDGSTIRQLSLAKIPSTRRINSPQG